MLSYQHGVVRKPALGKRGTVAVEIARKAGYPPPLVLLGVGVRFDQVDDSYINLLFGIGRNAVGSREIPCARRAAFVRFPGEHRTG